MRLEDWIVIMLAGVTLLVTLFGVGLAMLAIALGAAALWGYNGVVEAASKAATTAAREVSLEAIMKRATEAAKEIAQTVIWENKDKWLNDAALGLELPVAQSEPQQQASNAVEQVGEVYPGDSREEAKYDVNGDQHPHAGANNPATPDSRSR